MSTKPKVQNAQPVLEIKGGSFVVPIMRLLGADSHEIASQLAEKVAQAPDFFNQAPLVLDLSETSRQLQDIDLEVLCKAIRQLGITPIGIRSGTEQDRALAQRLGLAQMPESRPVKSPPPTSPDSSASKHSQQATQPEEIHAHDESIITGGHTRTITQPIRSGQRIYSSGDLIILAQVSNGAEIMAEGNIHVYGTLRGRALAGVQGNTESRIFCKDLQAELISIAGNYRISENLDESVRNKPVQIYLDNEALIIDDI